MWRKKEDKLTNKVLEDSRMLAQLVAMPEWKVAKKTLISQLIDLESINGLDINASSDELKQNVLVRQLVIKEIMSWLAKVEGSSEQQSHLSAVSEQKKEDIITYLDNG